MQGHTTNHPPAARVFTVSGSEHGGRLLEFVARRCALSNKQAKRLLDDRLVFVNRRRVWMARHPLAAGDRVEVPRPAAARDDASAPLRILHEDADYLVIDKPAGLLSNGPHSAESRLREQRQESGIEAVHRLDRETSGCLLMARRAGAKAAMITLFEARAVRKHYWALAAGPFPKGLRTLREPIDGQPATTRVAVLDANPAASLLDVEIETGRTHQIRRHLASAGHPVLGEKSYATAPIDHPALRRVTRHMLHAHTLSFTHPGSGQAVVAEAPAPADFAACARALHLPLRPTPRHAD